EDQRLLADFAGKTFGADQLEVEIARLHLNTAQAKVMENFADAARAPLTVVVEEEHARDGVVEGEVPLAHRDDTVEGDACLLVVVLVKVDVHRDRIPS